VLSAMDAMQVTEQDIEEMNNEMVEVISSILTASQDFMRQQQVGSKSLCVTSAGGW